MIIIVVTITHSLSLLSLSLILLLLIDTLQLLVLSLSLLIACNAAASPTVESRRNFFLQLQLNSAEARVNKKYEKTNCHDHQSQHVTLLHRQLSNPDVTSSYNKLIFLRSEGTFFLISFFSPVGWMSYFHTIFIVVSDVLFKCLNQKKIATQKNQKKNALSAHFFCTGLISIRFLVCGLIREVTREISGIIPHQINQSLS